MALVTPATCWKTPWTPQKQPPARMATSAVACGLAGSSSIGGGISRTLSAPDGKPRSAMPAPSNSAAKIDAGRTKRNASGTNCLPEAGLDEADDRMWHIRLLQRGNLVGRKFIRYGPDGEAARVRCRTASAFSKVAWPTGDTRNTV